jgi:hypothetical protein
MISKLNDFALHFYELNIDKKKLKKNSNLIDIIFHFVYTVDSIKYILKRRICLMAITKIKNWRLIKFALGFVGKKFIKEMTAASMDAKKAQETVLRSFLDYAKDSVYGKEHHFADILAADSASIFDLYQKNVPVNDYEGLRPYIERHKQGESDILFPGKPKMYGTTSGTTKEPKWIPITERYYMEVYKKCNQAWFGTLIMNKPKVFYGKTLSIVGKSIEGAAPDGTVYGSISGISQRDIPEFMKTVYSCPYEVFQITDYKARYYSLMRFGIEQDVTLLLTANPSTLVEMQTNANEFYDEYVTDIEHGTLSQKLNISPEIRAALEPCFKPNPKRAEELRQLKVRHGTVLPKHYWPNLQVVNVWMCGNTQVYLDKLRNSFPETSVFHEFSYFSTECRVGLVLKSNTLETTPQGHKVYIEFIPEDDIDNPNAKALQMWQVERGKRYVPIITTSSGLYRYDMHDIVEITGWYNQFPNMKFIQKCNGTISLTGEKLHETQFIDAVKACAAEMGLPLSFYVGFANPETSNYKFYYEFMDQTVTQARAEELTKAVDEKLSKYNVEYESKRSSNRVKAPETARLVKDSFEQFKAKCIDLGYRDGQFKLNLLMQDPKRQPMFEELVKK